MYLLTKDEKTILDILLLLFPKGEKFNDFCFYNHADIANFPYDYVAEVCRSLYDRGFLRELEVNDSETVTHLVIDYKGRSYKEDCLLNGKELWKQRLYGALVTVIIWAVKEIAVLLLQSPAQ